MQGTINRLRQANKGGGIDDAIARTGDFVCAPILILAFNRPKLVSALLKRISFAKPARIFFAVDAARSEAEMDLVEQTKKVILEIDWPCKVSTFFRTENRGCRNAPPEAISWFFDHVEGGIILEDDCHPAPEFLRLASELLTRYKDDERVGAITAFNRYNLQSDKETTYHFSKELNIWAWASWKRVWEKYDVTLERYAADIDRIIDNHTQNSRMRKYYRKAFSFVKDNAGSTWDFQFGFAFMANGYLSVVPRERLVSNMGISLAASTHTGGYDFFEQDFSTAGSIDFPIVHPAEVSADAVADDMTERIICGLVPRGIIFVGNFMPKCVRRVMTTVGHWLMWRQSWLFRI